MLLLLSPGGFTGEALAFHLGWSPAPHLESAIGSPGIYSTCTHVESAAIVFGAL